MLKNIFPYYLIILLILAGCSNNPNNKIYTGVLEGKSIQVPVLMSAGCSLVMRATRLNQKCVVEIMCDSHHYSTTHINNLTGNHKYRNQTR